MKKVMFVLVLSFLVLSPPVQSAVSIQVTFDGVLLHNEGWASIEHGYMAEERFLLYPPHLSNQTQAGTYELTVSLSSASRIMIVIQHMESREQRYITNQQDIDTFTTDVDLLVEGWHRLYVWESSDSVFQELFYINATQPQQDLPTEPVKEFFVSFRGVING
jgi:hypothetical protein